MTLIPYLGKFPLYLRTRLKQNTERDLPYCKLKVIFGCKCRLSTLFRFKDSLEKKIHSGMIYLYTCNNYKVKKPSATFIPERLNTW